MKLAANERRWYGCLNPSQCLFRPTQAHLESLGEKLVPIAADKRLKDVQQTLTLVDGSIVEALPRIAMASFRNAQAGGGKKLK